MLGVPVGLKLRIDLAVDQENAGRTLGDPGFNRLNVSEPIFTLIDDPYDPENTRRLEEAAPIQRGP